MDFSGQPFRTDVAESSRDAVWMRMALEEARLAEKAGEVPVGAVIVRGDELLARAHNRCERDGSAIAHAETLAIAEACRRVGHWRLSDCTLYVTLEPCPMCAGAAINARIGRVVFAARDPRMGACGGLLDLSAYPLEIRPCYEWGLMETESRALLRSFFAEMRKKNKK